jgi:VWFA-related protein
MKCRILVPGALLLLLSPAFLPSQEASPAPEQTPTLSVSTHLVVVDVVVRDSHGNFVHGLTQQDFKVLEDGKPQQIGFFDAHTTPTAPAAPPPPGNLIGNLTFTNVAPPGSVSGSINILLFDLLNTPGTEQVFARREMLKFLRGLPPGQRIALFVLTEKLRMLQGFTGSSDLLIAAAKMLDPKDFHLLRSQTQQELEADNLQRMSDALGGRDPSGSIKAREEDLGLEDAINTDHRARLTLGALAELARATLGYPGRKNLLWLSASFPLAVGAWMEYSPNQFEGIDDIAHTSADLISIRTIEDLVASAQIAVYPISILGNQTGGVGVESAGAAETSLAASNSIGHRMGTDREGQFNGRWDLNNGMEDLARQTGGKAFFGTNDIAGALQQSIQDGSNYYTLSYHPQNSNWNSQLRKIKIDLAQKGVSLSYRRGYFALPDQPATHDDSQEMIAALQPEAPESTMLHLRSQVELPNENHPTVLVTANIDAGSVQFTTDAAGHRHAKVLVLLVAFNDGAKQSGPPPQSSGVLNIDLDTEHYKAVVERGIGFQQALTLDPGKYRLRLGVSDASNHFIGTLDMPVTLAAPDSKNQ